MKNKHCICNFWVKMEANHAVGILPHQLGCAREAKGLPLQHGLSISAPDCVKSWTITGIGWVTERHRLRDREHAAWRDGRLCQKAKGGLDHQRAIEPTK